MSATDRRISAKVNSRLAIYRQKDKTYHGLIGNLATGVINIPDRNRMIYVTSMDGIVSEVLNRRVPATLGAPVIYGYDPGDLPNTLQVLSSWDVYAGSTSSNTSNAIGYHKEQHEWPNADTVYIWNEQIMEKLALPGVGLTVQIYPGRYYTSAGWVEVNTITVVDLSALSPALAAGECRYAMIVVDSAGAFAVRVGAVVTGWENLTVADIPALIAGDTANCAVKMFYGQTVFRKDGYNNDFVDLRFADSGNGIVPIAMGGTGQSTAQLAINALTDVAAAANEQVLTKDTATGNAIFKAASGGGTGDVVGPATAIDNHLAVYDGITGKLIKDGGAIPTVPTDATIAVTDVATNDVSTAAHGWFPKLPTAAGKFFSDGGTWETVDRTGSNGWVSSDLTWTYASASSFSVPGDMTAVYTKGTRLMWTQAAAVHYGIVQSSSFAAGVTSVTIIVNTDYVVENSAITLPYTSQLIKPAGFPEWFNWLPTWTGLTIGNATVTAIYSEVGGKLFFIVYAVLGSTSAVTGDTRFTLPVTSLHTPVGFINCIDASSGNAYYGMANLSGANCYIRAVSTSAAYMVNAVFSSTVPFTWAVGDTVRVSDWYDW